MGVAAVVAAALLVLVSAESGLFSRLGHSAPLIAIPGITLDDASDAPMPVVTSVGSESEAKRRGLQAGDGILAVNGRPVHSVAALRAIVLQAGERRPISLHVQRGDAMWDVSIDREEPDDGDASPTGPVNGAKDTAD